jgi:hypothetical protein
MVFRLVPLAFALLTAASLHSFAAIAVGEIGRPCGTPMPGYQFGCETPVFLGTRLLRYELEDVVLIRKGKRIYLGFFGWGVKSSPNNYYWISRQEFLDKVRKAPALTKFKFIRADPTWDNFFAPYGDPKNLKDGEEVWSYLCTYPGFLPDPVDPSKDESQWPSRGGRK